MEAARAAASGHDFLLVTAERQTQGRGTKGRAWQSPQGNIYLTAAVHRNFLPPERMRLFPLEAGLALWETAASFLPPAQRNGLRLKWPNDLLLDGAKLGGVLLEIRGLGFARGQGDLQVVAFALRGRDEPLRREFLGALRIGAILRERGICMRHRGLGAGERGLGGADPFFEFTLRARVEQRWRGQIGRAHV